MTKSKGIIRRRAPAGWTGSLLNQELVIRLYKQGYSAPKIARELLVCSATVYNIIHAFELKRPIKRKTKCKLCGKPKYNKTTNLLCKKHYLIKQSEWNRRSYNAKQTVSTL